MRSGALRDKMTELGVWNNTVFVFIMDHGQIAKDSLYEGGTQVAMFVRFPSRIAAGAEIHTAVSNLDIASTLLSSIGVGTTPFATDGESWWSLATTGVMPTPLMARGECIVSEIESDRMVVCGSHKYMSRYNISAEDCAVCSMYPASNDTEQLYDLQSDPNEQVNILLNGSVGWILTGLRSYLSCHDIDTRLDSPISCAMDGLPTPAPPTAESTTVELTTTEAPATTPVTSTQVPDVTTVELSTPLQCPTNCGTPERGGGTCEMVDGFVNCTSCNTDSRILQHGRCVQRIYCRSNTIVSGILVNQSCRCTDRNCFYCIQNPGSEVCGKCRNGMYLLNDTCQETCPADMALMGVSLWGRACMAAPFVCQSQRIQGLTESVNCKCPGPGNTPSPDCFSCDFLPGENGERCTKCRGNKYLYNNTCHSDCSIAPAGMLAYGVGSYGGECRAPFTCADGVHTTQGTECKCSADIGSKTCRTCDWSLTETRCTQCQSGRYLYDGTCLGSCPSGTTGVQVSGSTVGWECATVA